MMKKSERMQPIRKLAADREQDAVKALGQSQRALNEHEQKLEQLKNYRAEYAKLFQQHGTQGMDGAQLQAYQTFIAQIDVAIHQQRQMIEFANEDCAEKRQDWQQTHTRTQVMDKAIDRFKQAEQKQEHKRQQKEADDHTNARFWVFHNNKGSK